MQVCNTVCKIFSFASEEALYRVGSMRPGCGGHINRSTPLHSVRRSGPQKKPLYQILTG
jgi:hypothetical protein